MTKGILISFFILLQFEGATKNNWIEYLQSIKSQFYYKDTIIIKFKEGPHLDSITISMLVKVDTNYQKIFKAEEDTLIEEGGSIGEKYFYSFYLSKSNYATIVLYSGGMWGTTGNLYLYNFSPQGKLLSQIKLQDGWADAGESYYSNSKFENDSTFNVVHGVGFEKPDHFYYYAITEWDYIISKEGCVIQKSKMTYEKKEE
jgi:hypothetical protein